MGLILFIDSLILLFSFSIHPYFATSLDTITSSYVLKAPETLSSNDGKFHLGFFTPPNSTYSYLGIWYMSETAVVWVANRNQPIKDSFSGQLKISDDGNLVVMNANKDILWSTNLTNIPSKTRAQLQNTGNLVLQENSTESILWQSFQHPTNTLLQKMELSTGMINSERSRLTSWKSSQDPAIGEFSLSLERLNVPEMYAWRGRKLHWRSGPWNGQKFIGIPSMDTSYLNGNYVYASDGDNDTYNIGFNYANQSLVLMHMLTSDGNPQILTWDYANRQWNIEFSSISSECDVYGKCGAFASCDPRSSPICSCLRGYEPSNVEEWNRQNWSSGCVRKKPLQCEGAINGEEDGFLVLQNAKVPASLVMSPFLGQDCRSPCLGNCSCIAYAYDVGIGCMLWITELIDIQVFSNGGVDLYIRVPHSELDGHKKNTSVIIAVAVTIGIIIILICAFILWKRTKARARENLRARSRSQINVLDRAKLPDSELLQFEFQRLVAATNNFHLSNKIGQGGFGPVYKAWNLWNADRIMSLVDPAISSSCNKEDIMRCIHIGLLCVQELARDRPTMTSVVSMLSSETVKLPAPKQPTFILRQTIIDIESSLTNDGLGSINNVSITNIQGR
ncbi:hypothetical protein PIB30_034685 [Stylosanthes scabra]|uniref:Uncharacterized protein n=1 Tax=Stylosanthes scabra TaxID=79078 RepID=A0ABU6SCY9_9FABA|nr:hypothetical protein [Stylosanthes scabra]